MHYPTLLLTALLASSSGVAAPSEKSPEPTDSAEFKARKSRLIENVADHRLDKWREGYFTSNDPGKYLLGSAMAKLLLDPTDPDAIRLMNDRRAPEEHYHFAAVNWARFLPLFGEVLTPDTLHAYTEKASDYTAYTNPSGTENHRVMAWSSGAVLPHFLDTDRFGGMSPEGALHTNKEHLRTYVKGLYAAGQGEWDSSTYLLFDLNGLLNLYDFSPDPEVRLMADAGLQWLVAAYALKYRDGMFAGPHFRGFTEEAMSEITDQTGWLWWGSREEPTDDDLRQFLYSIHAATSNWRPNEILDRIARKDLPGLPVGYTASKPNYWHGHKVDPVAGATHEYVYLARDFTLGSLLDQSGGQITRWELVADTPTGPVHFWGGHPRRSDHTGKRTDHGYLDGIGYYDQLAQLDGSLLHMTMLPESEEIEWSFIAYPEGAFQGIANGWYVFLSGKTTVAVYPLGEKAELSTIEMSRKGDTWRRVKYQQPLLKIYGRQNAFVLEAGHALDVSALQAPGILQTDPLQIGYTDTAGHDLIAHYRPDERSAKLFVDGTFQVLRDQPIYDSPYVFAEAGILRISDGRESYSIDFTGNLPIFKTQ